MIRGVKTTKKKTCRHGVRLLINLVAGWGVSLFFVLPVYGAPLSSDSLSATTVLGKTAQQQLASKLFEDLYKISGGKGEALVAQRIALYHRIIDSCPDVPLAQESYWHLLEILMRDVQPPRNEEALRLYAAFNRRYPDSKMRAVVSHQVMQGLYQQGQWSELERIAVSYLQTVGRKQDGAPSAPVAVFLCAEARYRLGEIFAAQTGYEEIMQFFPRSIMAKIAKVRLAAMGDKAKADN